MVSVAPAPDLKASTDSFEIQHVTLRDLHVSHLRLTVLRDPQLNMVSSFQVTSSVPLIIPLRRSE